jgi:predicted RNA-binding protein with RPS1 domain
MTDGDDSRPRRAEEQVTGDIVDSVTAGAPTVEPEAVSRGAEQSTNGSARPDTTKLAPPGDGAASGSSPPADEGPASDDAGSVGPPDASEEHPPAAESAPAAEGGPGESALVEVVGGGELGAGESALVEVVGGGELGAGESALGEVVGGGEPAEVAAPDRSGQEARRGRAKPAGTVVEGVVTSVSPAEVELTLDDGRRAVINRRNFGPNDEDPTTILSVGDRVFGAELARDDPKRRVVLSRAWALKKQAWDRILQAAGLGSTVQGRVVSLGAKGVVVDVGVRGFVPTSHLELEPVADLTPYLDQTIELRVLEADPRRERLVLSRRSLLLKDQRRRAQELLASLQPGDTCRGRVTSLTDYGAFVDIGGINGLVHLSELSWQRVRRPADVVSLGDVVEVRVIDVKAKKRRVSLSLRQMTTDPLDELKVGEVRFGPVTRIVDFGAFVSLGDVEGLVHLSELAEYRVSTPEEVVAPGDEVGVKILSIDARRRRIELSIRRAAEFGG